MSQDIATQPLRQGRIWVDFGKLVLAAVVQGIAVSAVVALLVMVLASGSAADTPSTPDAATAGSPAPAAKAPRGEG